MENLVRRVIIIILLSLGIIYIFTNLFQTHTSIFLATITVFGLIYPIYKEYLDQKSQRRDKFQRLFDKEEIISNSNRNTEKVQKEIKKNVIKRKKVDKLKLFLGKLQTELLKENISKEELISNIHSNENAILIFKPQELDTNRSKNVKLIKERMIDLGFKPIGSGVSILPPALTPNFLRNKKDLDNWVDKNLLFDLPEDYRFILSFVMIIDLKLTTSRKKDEISWKKEIYEVLDVSELYSIDDTIDYLIKKKNLSIKDIINIPSFYFLSDNTDISLEDRNKLEKKDIIIIKNLKKRLEVDELKLLDIIKIEKHILKDELEKFVKVTNKDIDKIITNAKFWKKVFEQI